jgi:hypothetical protein
MKRLFRPSMLVMLSAGLAGAAAALVLWPRDADQAQPLPVGVGDQEVVWLNHATNIRDWERFVSAFRWAKPDGLEVEVDASKAFPRETTEVPELRVTIAGRPGRLLFRWYKLTGDLRTRDWVRALLKRDPPPLAIIGGSSSSSALALARTLKEQARGANAPLFLITQATADIDPSTPSRVPLLDIYPGRTFRFCFSNHQMAMAVTDFVWNRDNLLPRTSGPAEAAAPADDVLRPDADPAYLMIWQDDPYSEDLADGFMTALRNQAVRSTALDALAWTMPMATGGVPIDLAGPRRGSFLMGEGNLPRQWRIFHSIGSFNRPNHPEENRADLLLKEMARHSNQQRPLLVLPATSQPCRRFLRGLRRSAPVTARRFTVVTGDSIEFNKIYRDRTLTWPIQDLPFKLVFFCHRNPVDSTLGFREQDEAGADYDPNHGATSSGTEDLLLFIDIVETVVKAGYQNGRLLADADALARNLHQVKWRKRRLLFLTDGNRRSGTGEHVVYLRPPVLQNNRIAPRAELEVWKRTADSQAGQKSWALHRYLAVHYDDNSGEGE